MQPPTSGTGTNFRLSSDHHPHPHGTMHHLVTRAAALAAATLILTACDSAGPTPPEPPPPPPPEPGFTLERLEDLSPGQPARLVGTGFRDSLTHVTLFGDRIEDLNVVSDTEARFTLPDLRACESDGREITVEAGAADHLRVSGRLSLPDDQTLGMAVGGSRALELDDLDCLRLPAGEALYALTAVNLSFDGLVNEFIHPTDQLFRLVAWGDDARTTPPAAQASAPSAPAFARVHAGDHHHGHGHAHGHAHGADLSPTPATAAGGADYYHPNPVLFDSTFLSASVGDIVRFPASDGDNRITCSTPHDQVPSTIDVKIVAHAGHTLIGVDLDNETIDPHFESEVQRIYQRAAKIADPLILPTMRRVFDPAYEPPPGPNGRHLHVVSERGRGTATMVFTQDYVSQRTCALSSQIITTTLNASVPHGGRGHNARTIATTIIHEYAHHADRITNIGLGGSGISSGMLVETWAKNAEETAIRLAQNTSEGALRNDDLTLDTPLSSTGMGLTLYGASQMTPYTHRGGYGTGATLLLLARETTGEADLTSEINGPLLFQRMAAAGDFSYARLATLLGTTADDLLERWALAGTTDRIINPDVADETGTPRFKSWDNRWILDLGEWRDRLTNPTRTLTHPIEAPPRSYAARYLRTDAERGLSVQASDAGSVPLRLRLTRVR